jgi:hypothetical protein
MREDGEGHSGAPAEALERDWAGGFCPYFRCHPGPVQLEVRSHALRLLGLHLGGRQIRNLARPDFSRT